jgi:hypothetical protein
MFGNSYKERERKKKEKINRKKEFNKIFFNTLQQSLDESNPPSTAPITTTPVTTTPVTTTPVGNTNLCKMGNYVIVKEGVPVFGRNHPLEKDLFGPINSIDTLRGRTICTILRCGDGNQKAIDKADITEFIDKNNTEKIKELKKKYCSSWFGFGGTRRNKRSKRSKRTQRHRR